MEINEKNLKKILGEQSDKISANFDSKLDKMSINFDSKLEKQGEEYQRYLGAVSEDLGSKAQLIAEQHTTIIEKLDSHTEMIGELKVDMETVKTDISVLKSDMKIVKTDTEFIKGELGNKVSYEEFNIVKQRVNL